MKNQILRITSIFGLFLMLAITSVQAQTASRVEVKVPFDFAIGKVLFKAGTYSFRKVTDNTLTVRDVNGKGTTLVDAPLSIGSRDSKAGERLVFTQYGTQYFLSQVWLSVDSGRQLFPSAAETKAAREYKLANNNAKPQRVEVAAHR
ncbi:MAG TPA: hypothetical protein VFR80_01800 [Pyrinomonadaceae bacterium]|nr:hypothetical protein [Pyrinomonadaceae bacterium]